MEPIDLYRRCTLSFLDRVDDVSDDQWDAPTPCPEWSVRDLVAHVVTEDRWAAPIMHGLTTEEVGDRFAGDLLGDDPVGEAHRAAAIATGAIETELERREIVHLAYGDDDADEFVRRLAVDHLLHGWDLAMATTGDPRLDPDLVADVSAWFAANESEYRAAGAIGPRGPMHAAGPSVELADHLLAMTGRDSEWGPNHVALARFTRALEGGDVEGVRPLLARDCRFDTPGPAPEGRVVEGASAVADEIARLIGSAQDPHLLHLEGFVCGDRAASTWRYSWRDAEGARQHLDCASLTTFLDGRITGLSGYVKH